MPEFDLIFCFCIQILVPSSQGHRFHSEDFRSSNKVDFSELNSSGRKNFWKSHFLFIS
jgi:hypothetical protein